MAVPEPRHPLGERPVGGRHPVQPPRRRAGCAAAATPAPMRGPSAPARRGRAPVRAWRLPPHRAPAWSGRRAWRRTRRPWRRPARPGGARAPTAGAGGGRRRAHRSGSCGHGDPSMFEQCQESADIAPGLVPGATSEGNTVRHMARAFGVLLVAALAVLGGCASQAPEPSAAPRRPTRHRWPTCRTRSTRSLRTTAPPARPSRRIRTARGTSRRSATPRWRRKARRRRWPVPGSWGPPPPGWPTRWASSAARAAWPRRAWPGRPPQACGAVLKKIQADLTTMRTQLAAAATARPTP